MEPAPERGRALTTFAILFGILAISNLLKPLQIGGDQTGFVFFGNRLSGTANTIAGPIFGVFLAVYAYGIWTMRRWALPMGHAYATYVIINLMLWSLNDPNEKNAGYILFGVVYAVIAIGVSLGSAVLLTKRKAELR
jgi:hypothetical protein